MFYKEPYAREACAEYIRENAGTHFDPELVEVFEELEPVFYRISQQYADTNVNATHVRRVDVDRTMRVVSDGVGRPQIKEEPFEIDPPSQEKQLVGV